VFAVCCLLIVSAQAFISYLQGKRLSASRRQVDKKRNDLLARTDDILSKREILVAHEQQDAYCNKLDRYTDDVAEVMRHVTVREASYEGASRLISDYGKMFLLALALVLSLVISRDAIGDIGDVYFLSSMYVRLFVPIANLLNRYDLLKSAESTSETYLAVLAAPAADVAKAKCSPLELDRPQISFQGITFTYPQSHSAIPVLRNCSFTIPGGSVCLLLGPSGCGKTTIARLLLGFWRPTEGTIHLDGHDTQELSSSQMRALMSYVAQGDYITDDTVRENLCWSDKAIPANVQLIDALARVGIASDAEQAKSILEQPARTLSTGQQQRLSIARLMLDNAPIAILDEPLSGVDVFTLREVLPHIKGALATGRRTVLIISHRLAFASLASHVVILGSDRSSPAESATTVLEEGPKDELLANRDSILSKLHEAAIAELGNAKRDVAQT
jgi:ABC-type multidrug transport system fused ATPase/permease subunit